MAPMAWSACVTWAPTTRGRYVGIVFGPGGMNGAWALNGLSPIIGGVVQPILGVTLRLIRT